MKRFLTFLALCCLMAAGAWADVTTYTGYNPTAVTAAAEGYYVIEGLAQNNSRDHWIYDNNGNFATGAMPVGNINNYVWHVTASTDGKYRFQNVGTGRYIIMPSGSNNNQSVTLGNDGTDISFDFDTEGHGALGNGNNQWYDCGNGGSATTTWSGGVTGSRRMLIYSADDVLPAQGDYIRLQNRGKGTYLNANGAGINANADNTGLSTLWYVADNESGGIRLMNVASGAFMGNISNSVPVNLAQDNTTSIRFEKLSDDYVAFKQEGGDGYQYGHFNGGNTLVGWEKGNNNTQWTISKEDITPVNYTIAITGLADGVTGGGIVYGGQTCSSSLTAASGLAGANLTAAPVNNYYASITVDDTNITVAYSKLPFEIGKTYRITLHSLYAYYDEGEEKFKLTNDIAEDNTSGYFTIGGNAADGYTLYNVGTNMYVAQANSGNARATGNADAASAAHYDVLMKGTDCFFKIHGSANNYVNDNANNRYFSTWDNSDGLGDNGSKMTFTEVEDVPVTPAVVVPSTLNPASGNVEASALATITLQFTGEDVEQQGLIPMTAEKMGETPVYPTLTKGTTVITATSIALNEETGLNEITFLTTGITDGEWILSIPEGAFWVWNGELGAKAQPVAKITATYTVATAADPVPTAGKVYTIKAHFTNTSYKDIYLSSDTSAEQLLLPMPEAPTANQSYWVAENSGNTDRPWKFKSGYGYAKYLDWQSGTNGLSANGDNFGVLTCSTVEGTYHLNVSTSDRSIGTWGNNNDTKKGFGAVGSGGCWSQNKGHSNATASNYWTTDYIIEEVKNVDVYTVTGEGSFTVTGIDGYSYANTISAGGLVIVPSNINFTNANIQISNDYAATIDATNKTITLERITVEVLDKHLYTIKGAFNNNTYAPLICENNVIKTGANEDDPEIFVFFETTHDNVAGLAPVYKLGTVEGNGFFNWNVKGAANVTTKSEGADVAFPTSNSSVTWEGASVAEGYFGMVGIQKNSNNAYRTFVFKPSTNIDYNSTTSSVRAYNTLSGTGSWGSNYVLEEVTGYTVYDVILKNIDTTISYNGETGNCLTTTAQGNGGYLVIKDGAPLTAENITLAEEAEVVVTIDNTAHTVTVRAKGCPDEGTWYVTIENHEKGCQPFLFNDIQYADEITLQGASHDTSKNGYIWKVTSDGAGNLTVLNAENGKGIKPKSSNYSGTITNFQYEVYPADDSYFFLKFRTGSHDRLNASTSGFVNEAGQKAVTTWDGNHPDNAWKFNAVDTEDLVEYNVVVNPAESRGYAVYGGKKAGNGGFFLAPEGLTQSDFAGGELRAYFLGDVTLENHTITVNYTAATPIEVTYKLYLNDPIVDEHSQVTGYNEKHLADATAIVTEYIGKAPSAVPFDYPEYVSLTYPELVDGVFAAENTEVKVVSEYNDLMPFVPGMKTTVDIDVRNHYYFHVEKRTVTIDNEEKTLWLPCISPKSPTFEDDAAYIWVMEGDWYNGFRFHNDQIAKEAAGGDGTACHITFHHHEILSNTMEKMEGVKGETSLTEKTYTLVTNNDWNESRTRATLTDDATDTHSYFDLIYAPEEDQDPNYRKDHPDWQFRIHGTATGWKKANKRAGWYLNFRDYGGVDNYGTKDNPDSLLCIYNGGAAYADRASSFTFHKNEVCTEDDRQAVLAMIDAIEKGAVGAIIDKTAQEYQDLLTLKGRIEDTTIGCTRALFDIYTEKLVKYAGEKKTPADGEAYRLAVRTKEGRNFYLKDDGTYTTDSLDAAIYVLGSSADGTKKILAGNNNEDLYYFRNGGLTKASYAEGDCDFNYELMAGKETVADVLDATGAAKYATVCLTDGNGKVATMTSPDKATATGTCTWEEPQEVVYMNDELSSAIVMEPVVYPYTHPNFAHGTSDGRQGGFATIWLPFPMHFPDGIEVYKGTYMRDAKTGEICPYLMLTEVDKGNVTAAGGYLLYNAEQTESKMKQLVLPAPANPEDLREEEDAAFIGSTENPGQTGDATLWTEKFVNKYGDDFIPYVLADKSKDGKGIGFFRYTGATYPKGKAIYLSPKPAQGEAPAECIMFSFDDVIEAIESLHGHAITSEIYDLQGHRLNKVQKGQINVINGTKVMFK